MGSIRTVALCIMLASAAAAPIVHPSTSAGWTNTANFRSPLGTNLAGIYDWATEYPLLNRFKTARPWVPNNSEGSDQGTLTVDGNGTILSLSGSQTGCTLVMDGDDPTVAGTVLEVYYDGKGTLVSPPATQVAPAVCFIWSCG
jgi:hypothetical protein